MARELQPTDAIDGRLEAVVDGRAIGWAWDREHPDQPVNVQVVVNGRPVASGIADVERAGLAEAGIGDGRHGFQVSLPADLGDDGEHAIRVTVGPERVEVLTVEVFETMVRNPDGPWAQTKFVPEVGRLRRDPFVPDDEPVHDPGVAALVGEGGWLFLADERNLTAAQLMGEPLLDEERLEARAEDVVARHHRMRELRVPYLCAVAPMKERVYQRFLPEGLGLDPAIPTRQLNALLRSRNGGDVLNVLPALREARRSGLLFPRTGAEWSERGAFFAYRELMREAAKRVIDLGDPLLSEQATFVRRAGPAGDLAEKPKVEIRDGAFVEIDERSDWEEKIEFADASRLRALRVPAAPHLDVTPGRVPHQYERPDKPDYPRGMLIGDACCSALIPWLAEHFSRFVFLWADELPTEAIELEMPHVLIQVVAEARLVHGL